MLASKENFDSSQRLSPSRIAAVGGSLPMPQVAVHSGTMSSNFSPVTCPEEQWETGPEEEVGQ